jgi:bacterioferritin
MQGKPEVLKELNDALSGELKAIVQYIVHSEMCNNWGYQRYGAYIKKQAIDEMRHAEGLIERILFLDGIPNLTISLNPDIGGDVKKQIEYDYHDEKATVERYNSAVAVCRTAGDNGTRELFESMVKDEESHADFLDSQLTVIEQVGIQNFLSQQMHGEETGKA